MKKIFAALIFAVLLLTSVGAWTESEEGMMMLSYPIINTSTSALTTVIPITSIIPEKDFYAGVCVQKINPTTWGEIYATVYDSTTSAISTNSTEIMQETESQNGLSVAEILPHMRRINNAVCVQQGPNTVCIIYFYR